MNGEQRFGNFTSSNVYKLLTKSRKAGEFSSKAMTYIEEKRIERRMGRSIELEPYSRPIAWGTFLEQRVMNLLGLEYQLESNVTIKHPTIEGWSGTPDLVVQNKKIADIKCYQPKNFAQYTDVLLQRDIALFKKKFSKEYWQLVSNAILKDIKIVEAISYMPYLSELPEIRQMALDYQLVDQWKYRFIYEESDENLPYLPDNGYYKNLNRFEFEIPSEDIELLTEKIKEALKLL